jgi:hypothetical protein
MLESGTAGFLDPFCQSPGRLVARDPQRARNDQRIFWRRLLEQGPVPQGALAVSGKCLSIKASKSPHAVPGPW